MSKLMVCPLVLILMASVVLLCQQLVTVLFIVAQSQSMLCYDIVHQNHPLLYIDNSYRQTPDLVVQTMFQCPPKSRQGLSCSTS